MEIGTQRSSVGHAADNPLGNQLVIFLLFGLVVTVLASLLHRFKGAHPAVYLVTAPLEQDGLTGTFIHAGKQAANHHRMGTRANGLGQVA
jgi:hypothetical protein